MLIFDLDGTLLDTAKDLHIALNFALEKHGFRPKTEQETLALLGNGIEALVAGAIDGGKENPQFLVTFTTFKDYYFAHLNDYTKPYSGILDLLSELKARHIKMGIVSNKFDEGVKALAIRFFKGYIDYAQGVCATVQKKPAPDAVFALIKEQNAENEKNIYIGDSEVDLKTAQNAGLDCISVSWGFRSKDFLRRSGAKTIIDHPKELLALL
ncbi:MAG: HAD family hydrolase [Alphaproteobacteria bacterium]|nr:HAD family hydrolase [Alphaproteobacteria bacterium]